MKIELDNYCKLYSKCFDKKVLKQTISELNQLDTIDKKLKDFNFVSPDAWESHYWGDHSGKKYIKEDNTKELESTAFVSSNNQLIMDTLYQYILKYMTELNHPTFNAWAGYTKILFHRYKTNTCMLPHVDHIRTIFDGKTKGVPILSVVGQLNDGFKGGEFVILKKKFKMKAGDILIFPSNFIFLHEVAEVTKGTRLSFISWVY